MTIDITTLYVCLDDFSKLYESSHIGKDIFAKLWENGLHLITGIRSNMKNYLMPFIDKMLLRKRFLVETVFGILKTDMNLEHSRHQSPINAFVNILACIAAYCYKTIVNLNIIYALLFIGLIKFTYV